MISATQARLLRNLRNTLNGNAAEICKFESQYGVRLAEYDASAPPAGHVGPTPSPTSSSIIVDNPPPKAEEPTHRDKVLAAAADYRGRGWPVLKLKGKETHAKRWTKTTATDPMPDFDAGSNIGIVLGDNAGGLVRPDFEWAAPHVAGIIFPEPCPTFGRGADAPATGLPKLIELLDLPADIEKTFRNWLGIANTKVDDHRAQITYGKVDDLRVLNETQRALLAAEAPIFQRAGMLVHAFRLEREERVEQDDRTTWSLPAGSLVIKDIGDARLRLYLSEYIRYVVPREDSAGKMVLVPIQAPKAVASDFIAQDDAWRLRVLRGVVETPTLRSDGSVLERQGWDPQSRLIVDTGSVEFGPVLDNPTKDDALQALTILDEAILEFPFDSNSNGTVKWPSRSVALSLFLSSLVAGSLPAIPLHLGDAPVAGSGKTVLGDAVSIVATGREAAKMAEGRDEAEDEKRLTGAVLKGCPMLIIDNVEQALGGDFLCSIITGGRAQVRILGSTGQHEVETKMLIYATGNNIKVRGDMVRRCVKCRIDAGKEQPEKRAFKRDLIAFVAEHRTKLVAAALTIMRAFVVAPDRQEVLRNLESYAGFDAWSERVRAPLIWLGESDPCASRESVRDDDPVTTTLATLVAAWAKFLTTNIGLGGDDGWSTTGQLCDAAAKVDRQHGEDIHPLLRAALETIMPRGVTADGLGRYLSRYVDRIVGGYRLRKRQHPTTRLAQYLIEPAPKSEQTGPKSTGSADGKFNFMSEGAAT